MFGTLRYCPPCEGDKTVEEPKKKHKLDLTFEEIAKELGLEDDWEDPKVYFWAHVCSCGKALKYMRIGEQRLSNVYFPQKRRRFVLNSDFICVCGLDWLQLEMYPQLVTAKDFGTVSEADASE